MKFGTIALYAGLIALMVKFGGWLMIQILEFTQTLNVLEWFLVFFITGTVARYLVKIERS